MPPVLFTNEPDPARVKRNYSPFTANWRITLARVVTNQIACESGAGTWRSLVLQCIGPLIRCSSRFPNVSRARSMHRYAERYSGVLRATPQTQSRVPAECRLGVAQD